MYSEDSSKQLNEILSFIFDNSNDLIAILDETLLFEWINEETYERIMGYSKDDLIGTFFVDLIHHDDKEYLYSEFNTTITVLKEREGQATLRLRHKDNSFRWFIVKGLVYKSKKGEGKFFSIARDITEQKKSEQRFKQVEKKYNILMEIDNKSIQLNEILNFIFHYSNDLVAIYNVNLEHEWINEDSHQKLLGLSKEEILGTKFIESVHLDDREYLIDNIKHSNFPNVGDIILRRKAKDGSYKWFEIKTHIFKSQSGENKIFTISRDISEQIKLEKELKESKDKFQLIMDKTRDFIIILGDGLKVEYINEKVFQNALGYSNEDLIGKSALDFIHPDYHKKVLDAFKVDLNAHRQEILILDKKGSSINIEIRGSTFITDKGEIKAIVIGRDVTKRRDAQQKIITSEKKYREAFERIDFYKDLFSHDINNILQTIMTSSELFLNKLNDKSNNDELKGFLSDIRAQVNRGTSLVSNVQALSKIEVTIPLMKKTEIILILKEAIKYIQKSYQNQINIQVESQETQYFIYANELLLDVFENILINAVKHNSNQVIDISIRISKEKKNNTHYIKIEFRDNGKGIEDSRKTIIFQRGFKGSDSLGGMGLGLSLVKKIIDLYKGKVWVEDNSKNNPSKGSNFIVLLPII